MRIIKFGKKLNKEITLLLGYFDTFHLGHQKLFEEGIKNLDNSNLACFLMVGNIKTKDVYTFKERVKIAEDLGAKYVIWTKFDDKFKNLSPKDFVDILKEKYNIKKVICGFDFSFGKDRQGNSDTLIQEFSSVIVVPKFQFEGEKVSSSKIKELLKDGDVTRVNKLLGREIFIGGKVVKGRQIGRTIGFPTINQDINNLDVDIKEGVYLSSIVIKNIKYKGITNIGCQPTVNGSNKVVETYIDGFSGNLYGKFVKVYINKRIRDIQKFNSLDELKERLNKDLEENYD